MDSLLNSNNNSSGQSAQTNSKNIFQSFFNVFNFNKKSSRFRICKTDPNDHKFMICKTVITDSNGTKEQQERIPADNDTFKNSSTSQSLKLSPKLSNSTKDEDKKVFEKNNQSSDEPKKQSKKGFQLSSRNSSKNISCQGDPQDDEYIICKSTISDKKGTKETEQRIKISNGFKNSQTFRQMVGEGQDNNKPIKDIIKQMGLTIRLMINPLIRSVNNLMKDSQGLDKNMESSSIQQGYSLQQSSQFNQEKRNQHDKTYFKTSYTKKDPNTYEL